MRRDHIIEDPVNVTCPHCGRENGTLSGLIQHLKSRHPSLSTRERSVIRDLARREAGWWGVRP